MHASCHRARCCAAASSCGATHKTRRPLLHGRLRVVSPTDFDSAKAAALPNTEYPVLPFAACLAEICVFRVRASKNGSRIIGSPDKKCAIVRPEPLRPQNEHSESPWGRPPPLPARGLYYSIFFVRATDVSATIFGGTHTSLFPVETDGDIGMPRKTQISARSGYTQQRGEQGTPYSARLGDCHFLGRPNFQLDRQ